MHGPDGSLQTRTILVYLVSMFARRLPHGTPHMGVVRVRLTSKSHLSDTEAERVSQSSVRYRVVLTVVRCMTFSCAFYTRAVVYSYRLNLPFNLPLRIAPSIFDTPNLATCRGTRKIDILTSHKEAGLYTWSI